MNNFYCYGYLHLMSVSSWIHTSCFHDHHYYHYYNYYENVPIKRPNIFLVMEKMGKEISLDWIHAYNSKIIFFWVFLLKTILYLHLLLQWVVSEIQSMMAVDKQILWIYLWKWGVVIVCSKMKVNGDEKLPMAYIIYIASHHIYQNTQFAHLEYFTFPFSQFHTQIL
jgi:hypothetical protein